MTERTVPSDGPARRSLSRWFADRSVKAKVSLGFAVVLALHLTIAATGHYGLAKSDGALRRFDELHHDVLTVGAFQREFDRLQRSVLLFTHTGHESQAGIARDLYDRLDEMIATEGAFAQTLVDVAEPNRESEGESLRRHLARHRSLFDAVVEDRAGRRRLKAGPLATSLAEAVERIEAIDASTRTAREGEHGTRSALAAALGAADASSSRFMLGPDSRHVRAFKEHIADAREAALVGVSAARSDRGDVASLVAALDEYERVFLQIVQATRGYLHLVNVVMAGESVELEHAVAEQRRRIVAASDALAEDMLAESRAFAFSNNTVSMATILLGIIAAAWIGRQIAPPLNAVTDTLQRMADGEECGRIPGLDRRDEVGRLARAAQTFRMTILEATARLELFQRTAHAGAWDWDIAAGTLTTNEAYRDMLGESGGDESMSPGAFVERIHPDDTAEVERRVQDAHDDPTARYDVEFRLRHADGTYRWIRSLGAVTDRAEDGTPLRMIGQHLDVQSAREMLEQAEAANRSKSEFLANMSHEIRTPMTAILGYLELLDVDDDLDPERIGDAVRTVQSNADHLLTVINDILDMSKIEAGQLRLESIAAAPVRLVAEVASLASSRAGEKGVDLRVEYATAMPERITTDPTRLRQVLLNVVSNAIKFTEEGSVTIRTGFDGGAGCLRFDVIDTGIGMTDEQRSRIERFEAFNQADTSMSRRFGGSGLGLRISHTLAEMLGGGIRVASRAGEGSTFTVTVAADLEDDVRLLEPSTILPWREEQARERRAAVEDRDARGVGGRDAAADGGRPLDGLRILVAEDGADNQRLIAHHLERAGAAVTVAANGRIAIEQIDRAPVDELPHVVLMDMQMPELDGYEATRRLRDAGRRLPIVALTAHAMQGDRERCLHAGCDDYLTKPIARDALVDACARHADRARAENERAV